MNVIPILLTKKIELVSLYHNYVDRFDLFMKICKNMTKNNVHSIVQCHHINLHEQPSTIPKYIISENILS